MSSEYLVLYICYQYVFTETFKGRFQFAFYSFTTLVLSTNGHNPHMATKKEPVTRKMCCNTANRAFKSVGMLTDQSLVDQDSNKVTVTLSE